MWNLDSVEDVFLTVGAWVSSSIPFPFRTNINNYLIWDKEDMSNSQNLSREFVSENFMPIIAAKVGILKNRNKFQETKQQLPLTLCFLEPSKICNSYFFLIFFNYSVIKMGMNSQLPFSSNHLTNQNSGIWKFRVVQWIRLENSWKPHENEF